VIKNKNCKLYRINGVEDHLHIFSDLHPGISLSDYIKDIKIASSGWMKASGKFQKFEAWQEGYGAFTYSIREKDMIIDYIRNQKEHHKTETYYDEFKRLLTENGIDPIAIGSMRNIYYRVVTNIQPLQGCSVFKSVVSREFHSRLLILKSFGLFSTSKY